MSGALCEREAIDVAAQSTQFCVALENRPGSFARLCSALAAGGVQFEAVFVSDDEEWRWVNFVARPEEAAEELLARGEYHFFKERVLTMQLADRPEALEQVATRLADAGVNIDYVYGGGAGGGQFHLVLSVSDLDEALRVLSSAERTAAAAV